MSDFTIPQLQANAEQRSESIELVAANRRLTTVMLGMVLLTGMITCLSYLAGRTVTQIRAESAAVVRTELPSSPLVIDPLNKPSASITVAPVAAPPVPAEALYLQVGLMDPGVDLSMQNRLVARGYKVRLMPMDNSPVARVLVGPILSVPEQRELETKLASDGFKYFPRRY